MSTTTTRNDVGSEELERMYTYQRDRLVRYVLRLSISARGPTITQEDAEDLIGALFVDILQNGQRVALQIMAHDRYVEFIRRRDAARRASQAAAADQAHDHDHDPTHETAAASDAAGAVRAQARDSIDTAIIEGLARGDSEREIAATLTASGNRMTHSAVRKRKLRLRAHTSAQ